MKQQRLDGLADGIFAIVMTLLAFELRVPALEHATDGTLLNALFGIMPVFVSFILSFSLLFTYWRAHHFLTSVYARALTVGLANYNALFFLFITLIPFSARLLGEYSNTHTAIIIYALNVIAIGVTLYLMRVHIEKSPHIETTPITKADRRSGYIRILFPVFSAVFAVLLGYINTGFSMALFTIAILFNILPASSNVLHYALDRIFEDDHDLVD